MGRRGEWGRGACGFVSKTWVSPQGLGRAWLGSCWELAWGSPSASPEWLSLGAGPQCRSLALRSSSLTGFRPMKKDRTKISYVRAQRNFSSVLFRTAHCLRGHYLILTNYYQLFFWLNIWIFVQFFDLLIYEGGIDSMSSLYESVLQIIISKYWQLLLHSDSRLVRSQANSSSASNTAILSFGNSLLKFFCFSIGKTPSFRYNRLQKRRVFTVQFLLKRAARFFFYYQQVIKIFFSVRIMAHRHPGKKDIVSAKQTVHHTDTTRT